MQLGKVQKNYSEPRTCYCQNRQGTSQYTRRHDCQQGLPQFNPSKDKPIRALYKATSEVVLVRSYKLFV